MSAADWKGSLRVDRRSTVLGQQCYLCGEPFRVADQVAFHVLPGFQGAVYAHRRCALWMTQERARSIKRRGQASGEPRVP